jgi:hypothetical protein
MNLGSISASDYVTFGRPVEFVLVLVAQVSTILFAIIPSAPPVVQLPGSEETVMWGLGVAILFLFGGLFYTIRWVSRQTYSVTLQKTRHQLISFLAYAIFGICAVISAYVVFILPYPNSSLGVVDVGAGLVYSAIFAESILVLLGGRIWRSTETDSLRLDIKEFIQALHSLRDNPVSSTDSVEVISTRGERIVDRLADSKFKESQDISRKIDKWLSEFDEASTLPTQENLATVEDISNITKNLCSLVPDLESDER